MACMVCPVLTYVRHFGNSSSTWVDSAGRFPKTLQCDFDTRLIGGKAAALLRSHGTRIWAAPPYCQDKNGLVKRK